MKFWRGYVIAAVIFVCALALRQFAGAHSVLVDMVYPYVTRLVQTFLANWSSGAAFCIWQMALLTLIAILISSILMMIIRKWNFFTWLGWVLTGVSILVLLNTGIYGLNTYSGSLVEDVRLEETEYTVTELENAASFFRDQANTLAENAQRSADGALRYPSFDQLAQMADDGFRVLTYEKSKSVFAGSTIPVKPMTWKGFATLFRISGTTVALTGEATVNPNTPAVALPWVMCREMAHRMSISKETDAELAAFLTCYYNSAEEFQYAANLIAYHYCCQALKTVNTSTGLSAVQRVEGGAGQKLQRDLKSYTDFFGKGNSETVGQMCNYLVSWCIQTVVLPAQTEEQKTFDPMDESQVDLSGIVNAKPAA